MNSHRASLLSSFIDYLQEEHDWRFDRDEFDDRFLLQKYVFFAQELGLQTDYSYDVYVFGAYSPSLARDYYDEEVNERQPYQDIVEQLDQERFHEVVHQKDADWLEVASTLVLLDQQYHHLMPRQRQDKIVARTMGEKNVPEEEVVEVLEELQRIGVL